MICRGCIGSRCSPGRNRSQGRGSSSATAQSSSPSFYYMPCRSYRKGKVSEDFYKGLGIAVSAEYGAGFPPLFRAAANTLLLGVQLFNDLNPFLCSLMGRIDPQRLIKEALCTNRAVEHKVCMACFCKDVRDIRGDLKGPVQ